MTRTSHRNTRRAALAALLAAGTLTVAGCFDEPKTEEKWTRIDVKGANLSAHPSVPAGSDSFNLQLAITYRRIITGFVVADLRVSPNVTHNDVDLAPDADRVRMANDIDNILQNSVTLGRATRAITGWDHLIQDLTLSFRGAVPDTGSVFLVVYLGAGDEVERVNQPDTLIVTPFDSNTYQLLPVGYEVAITP